MDWPLAAAAPVPPAASPTPPVPTKPPAIPGSIGLRLLDAPISAGNDPRARIYIVDHLSPATVIHRQIEVSNTTAGPVPIVLYPAAATITNTTFLGAAGHTPNDLSSWTSVLPATFEIPAG